MKLILSFLLLLVGFSCANHSEKEGNILKETTPEFNNYWYDGMAELNIYNLEQARYGEIHKGESVLIFVTEDFRNDKFVKYEGGPKDDVESVLKLNFMRNFVTGIYPYSMMTSVFTPISTNKPSLKVSTSSQEWCGHTYSQVLYKGGQYELDLSSYFQEESYGKLILKNCLLEDELWTTLRMNPYTVPVGEIELIPGLQTQRFNHRKPRCESAISRLEIIKDSKGAKDSLLQFQLEYLDMKKNLRIVCGAEFPYPIFEWEEQMIQGSKQDGLVTTKAVLKHRAKLPYWELNAVKDSVARKSIGL